MVFSDAGIRFRNGNGFTMFMVGESQDDLVNYVQVNGSESGNPVMIYANGTDDNIDIRLVPKGDGLVRLGARTASSDAAITGYITVKDSGGTTRKLAVIS
jgi:hypothetical protein